MTQVATRLARPLDGVAPERPWKYADTERLFALDMRPMLEDGEALDTATSGAMQATLVEVDTTDLVISSVTVSDDALVIDGETVPAGEALQALIENHAVTLERPTRYKLKAKVWTTKSGSIPQSLVVLCYLDVLPQDPAP